MFRISIIFLFSALFVGLATATATRGGRFNGMDRMNEPEIDQCLKSKLCIITMDLRPSCGSDGRTYPNTRTIDCLNECLSPEQKVTIVSGGFCKDDTP